MREKYLSLSLESLKEIAKARGLKGISTLKKSELVERMVQEDEKERQEKENNSNEQNQETRQGNGEIRSSSQDTRQNIRPENNRTERPPMEQSELDSGISVSGIFPSFMPDSDASMMSMNTTPLAPSSAVPGKQTNWRRPDTNAVKPMPISSLPLPYFSSRGGPTTRSSSMFPRKCSRLAWPRTWPTRRT